MEDINYLQADEQTIEYEFLRLIFNGIKERYDKRTDEIIDRADDEFEALKAKNYLRYLLVAYDLTRFARESGLEFMARGSLNNSLLCYLLGISDIDPLHFDLPFRLPVALSKNEVSFPKIWIDFEEETKEKVIAYLQDKYGADNVSKAIAKSENGRIGINACMVVLDNDLSAKAETAIINGERVVMLTRDEIEMRDIFFMDFTSSKALSFYKKLKLLVKQNYHTEIAFDCKDCTDEETLKLFGTGDTDGIFMFDDCDIREQLKNLKKPSFDNLIDLITLNEQLAKNHFVPFAFLAYKLAYFKAHYRKEFEVILRETNH